MIESTAPTFAHSLARPNDFAAIVFSIIANLLLLAALAGSLLHTTPRPPLAASPAAAAFTSPSAQPSSPQPAGRSNS